MAQLRSYLTPVVFTMLSISSALSAPTTETVTLKTPLKIPEATLQPGQYTFSVEDHLQDRAIVQITSTSGGTHYLVLAVPDSRIKTTHSGTLIRFHSAAGSGKESLQAWACPGCDAPLAFVYPKAEAAAITSDSAQPVLAVDPSYDKLPDNLTQDDMKVVTLWLLAPKEITPDHKGEGVTGAKLADIRKGSTGMASAAHVKRQLPKTAGDTYEWALAGIGMLFAGLFVRWNGSRARANR